MLHLTTFVCLQKYILYFSGMLIQLHLVPVPVYISADVLASAVHDQCWILVLTHSFHISTYLVLTVLQEKQYSYILDCWYLIWTFAISSTATQKQSSATDQVQSLRLLVPQLDTPAVNPHMHSN